LVFVFPQAAWNKGTPLLRLVTKKASIIKKAKTTDKFLLPWPKL